MTTARQIIADTHQRLLAPRLAIRRMLLNITTVEGALWRGARVCLHKQDYEDSRGRHLFYYAVISGATRWTSQPWQVSSEPTRARGRNERAQRQAAVAETVSYLLALQEVEAQRCAFCGGVIVKRKAGAKFCSDGCYKDYWNARRSRKRGA